MAHLLRYVERAACVLGSMLEGKPPTKKPACSACSPARLPATCLLISLTACLLVRLPATCLPTRPSAHPAVDPLPPPIRSLTRPPGCPPAYPNAAKDAPPVWKPSVVRAPNFNTNNFCRLLTV